MFTVNGIYSQVHWRGQKIMKLLKILKGSYDSTPDIKMYVILRNSWGMLDAVVWIANDHETRDPH